MPLDTKAPVAEIQSAFTEKLAAAGLKVIQFTDIAEMARERRATRCTEIADTVVPQYRDDNQRQPGYSCTGIYAKRWQAAWDAACIALGGDPKEYVG